MAHKIVLFGATGFTGRLTAKSLVSQGASPLLVGRNLNKLNLLANELGGLNTATANVGNLDSLADVLNEGDVLISTVGPFTRFGDTAIQAAISKKAHYIDSTGEPGFIRKVFEQHGPQAKTAGITLLTAFGYDYVPGNAVAAAALNLDESATKVDVGYFVSGKGISASQGTQASVMQAMLDPGVYFAKGRLTEKVFDPKIKHFKVGGRRRPAASVAGSEHLALPMSYPSLIDINTYLGWFGAATYVMPLATGFQTLLLKIPGYHRVLDTFAQKFNNSKGQGPNEYLRSLNNTEVMAVAYNSKGKAVSEATLFGVNPYDYTADMLAWSAIHGLKHGYKGTGALGPVAAFGSDVLLSACEECGLNLSQRKL